MTAILRAVAPALASALTSGAQLWRAAIFAFTLADGTTVLRFTSWDSDLVIGGETYSSRKPWVEHSDWDVSNTMEIPQMTVTLRALNDAFRGGAQIKQQIHNGLFDGAFVDVSWVFMSAPGAAFALDTVPMFGGVCAGIDITGTTATIQARGKNNLLDQNAPRNLYQISCLHAFCDAGCALSRATFTATNTVGSGSGGPTASFVPWGSVPGSPTVYQNGFMVMTSGVASGSRRSIAVADSAGLTLAYPFYNTPAHGDAFSVVQGCDKTFNSGSGQSCTDYSNTQHYKGYEFIPSPTSAY